MIPLSLQKRAEALYKIAATSFRATGRVVPIIVFDLQDEAKNLTRKYLESHVPDDNYGRDALANYVRRLCNTGEGGSVVYAVYVVTLAWGSVRDMTEDELVAAVTKYGGGPRVWPDSERAEKIVVAGDERNESITIEATVDRADKTVSEATIRTGPASGRMSRFFERGN